jgi:hypothetical protein
MMPRIPPPPAPPHVAEVRAALEATQRNCQLAARQLAGLEQAPLHAGFATGQVRSCRRPAGTRAAPRSPRVPEQRTPVLLSQAGVAGLAADLLRHCPPATASEIISIALAAIRRHGIAPDHGRRLEV